MAAESERRHDFPDAVSGQPQGIARVLGEELDGLGGEGEGPSDGLGPVPSTGSYLEGVLGPNGDKAIGEMEASGKLIEANPKYVVHIAEETN
jgi:hypothetical protein